MTANLRTLTREKSEVPMKRLLMPTTTLTTLKKVAFTLLCCSVLMVFGASAQAQTPSGPRPGVPGPPSQANNQPTKKTTVRSLAAAAQSYDVSGTWVDSYNYVWTLTENPSTGAITGTVVGCTPDGTVTGTATGNQFTLVVTDPPTCLDYEYNMTWVSPTSAQGTWFNWCVGESGDQCGGASVTMNLTAATLTVTGAGLGNGTVTDNYTPQEIDCTITAGSGTGTCTANYPINTNVMLTATPADDGVSTFGGWGGACASSVTNTCNVTMSMAQNVIAIFNAPGQTQVGTVTTGAPTLFIYNGGFILNSATSGYDMTQQLTSGSPTEVSVTAIPFTSQSACNNIFKDTSFSAAFCFTYLNGDTVTPEVDAPVGFEVTCPGSPTGGTCGSSGSPSFLATLGSDFYFNAPSDENLGLGLAGSSPNQTLTYLGGNPYVGVVKFSGPDPLHPCSLPTGTSAPSPSNQAISFNFIDGTPGAKPLTGGSSGTGSCWLFMYNMPDEVPTASITAPGNGQDVSLNSVLTATFTCNAINKGASSPVGPYLTLNSCTLTDTYTGSGSPASYPASFPAGAASVTFTTTQIDTSSPGPHTLTATVVDSATNTAPSSTVTYYVQGTSSTAVSSSSNPSSYGQSVTFTATVTGVVTPTGTVTWSPNTGCATTMVNSGVATCTTSILAVGTDVITAAYSGDNSNSTSTGTLSQVVSQASQTITLSGVPATAAYNTSFTVVATGGASGNPVTFTSSGVCSNVGATYTMTSSAGTCSVIANQAGNTNYSAAPQVTQTVNATGPLLSLTPTSINFGTAYLFNVNAAIVTVKNIGTSTVQISNVSLTLGSGTNEGDFSFLNFCPSTLAPGKNCFIIVFFFAGNVGTLSATLNIADNAPLSPQQVSLSATVINPQASLRPSSLNFGTIKVGQSSTQNVTLTNPGTTPLTITSISVTGANAHDFVPNNACPNPLAPSTNCTISVTFTPSARGSRSANLTVIDNAQKGRQNVSLSGNGGGD
jgi:Bacterial Ig-like domain (group 3)/Abnormal spindle-like microcephaly-assoc'd, ASPM-SPD-2-Hydin